MKKFAIVICIILILGCVGIVPFRHMHTATEVPDSVEVPDNSVYITISAAGDCTFGTDTNYSGAMSFEAEMEKQKNNYSHFLKLVKPIFEEDDLTIVNFEGTLSDRGGRQDKQYAFRGKPEYVKILTSSSVEAVNLANNHTRDYGEVALTDTKTIMTENNVMWVLGEHYVIKDIKGVKIGIVGSNALTYEGKTKFPKIIEEMKNQGADLVIANFHWGEESSKNANETQVSLAHLAIDSGADLVIGHHPHVLQGIEKYKGKYIVYSLGNFAFGGHKNPYDKDTMIFRQTFRFKDGVLLTGYENAEIIPCSISSVKERNNYQPMPLSGDEFKRVMEKIIDRSKGFYGIGDVKFTER